MSIPMPQQIAALPRNRVGYPIPFFVDRSADVNGEPDFRIADSRKMRDAIRFDLCWICGKRRGRTASFVIGPMCAINRTSAEPPGHLECAIYSAQTCPFLNTPRMIRRDKHKPGDSIEPPGIMLKRNPGVTLVWTSRDFHPYHQDGGWLWDIGNPQVTRWFCEGRTAHPTEIMASVDSGLPLLQEVAQEDGAEAMAELDQRYRWLSTLVGATR